MVQNPVLLAGEIGFERDTGRYKMGDGTTAWNDLAYPYLEMPLPPETNITYQGLTTSTATIGGVEKQVPAWATQWVKMPSPSSISTDAMLSYNSSTARITDTGLTFAKQFPTNLVNSCYVDFANGNDSNAGTQSAPFKTMSKVYSTYNRGVRALKITLMGGSSSQFGTAPPYEYLEITASAPTIFTGSVLVQNVARFRMVSANISFNAAMLPPAPTQGSVFDLQHAACFELLLDMSLVDATTVGARFVNCTGLIRDSSFANATTAAIQAQNSTLRIQNSTFDSSCAIGVHALKNSLVHINEDVTNNAATPTAVTGASNLILG